MQEHTDNPEVSSSSEAHLLLTVPEVCRILRRSRARVYELIHSKELAHIKDGRSILVPADAPEAWIKSKRRQNGF